MPGLLDATAFLLTLIGMEFVAGWVHRHVMHGVGWAWHQSHHVPRSRGWEKNDVFALFFAPVAAGLVILGARTSWTGLWGVGMGMTAYGLLYALVHDGLVHQRWPFRFHPRRGYLKRLVQAHRLHHASGGKEGAVSFGFLYPADVRRLAAEVKARRLRAPVSPLHR